jgi:hypothetical protein
MELLIQDIRTYLNDKTTIRGFTRERLEHLMANKFDSIQGYEIRFLVLWSGLYLYQFESTYEISIDDLN